MAVNTRNSIVTNGLVLYLDAANRISYVSGSTAWNDMSGFSNNGTLVNGPTFNTGDGGSIVFDGVNDYITLGTQNLISTDFTINLWFNATTNTTKEHFIISLGYSNNPSFLITQDTQNNGESSYPLSQ
jgi:hypothetical protein